MDYRFNTYKKRSYRCPYCGYENTKRDAFGEHVFCHLKEQLTEEDVRYWDGNFRYDDSMASSSSLSSSCSNRRATAASAAYSSLLTSSPSISSGASSSLSLSMLFHPEQQQRHHHNKSFLPSTQNEVADYNSASKSDGGGGGNVAVGSGEASLKCISCPKSFSSLANLKIHAAKVHRRDIDSTTLQKLSHQRERQLGFGAPKSFKSSSKNIFWSPPTVKQQVPAKIFQPNSGSCCSSSNNTSNSNISSYVPVEYPQMEIIYQNFEEFCRRSFRS